MKVAGGVTRAYIYDAGDIVEERITGSSSDTIRFYHDAGIDEPLARKNSSDVVTYYLSDHLGSIVRETSASGGVVLEREYGPWGDLLSGASTAGYAFQGREWDSEIGMFYFRARYYNPAAGAWASEDPIGFAGGSNVTQFVNNNPVRFVDPLGLCSSDEQQNPKMTLSPTGRDFIKRAETGGKPRLTTHDDGRGNATIGYGHKLQRGESFPNGITAEQAEQILSSDIAWAERAVNDFINPSLRQHEFDALVEFVFNSGRETLRTAPLRRNINNNDITYVSNFTNVNPGGSTQRGIDNRKTAEATLCFHGRYR